MEPGPHQQAILKSIEEIQQMLDELADLRSKGQVSGLNIQSMTMIVYRLSPQNVNTFWKLIYYPFKV